MNQMKKGGPARRGGPIPGNRPRAAAPGLADIAMQVAAGSGKPGFQPPGPFRYLAADPLFDEVQKALMDYVRVQPPVLRAFILEALDRDADCFLDAYHHMRSLMTGLMEDVRRAMAEKKKAAPAPAPRPMPGAPVLERTGRAAPETTETEARARRRAELADKIRTGAAGPLDFGKYLDATGAVDQMANPR